MAQKYTNPKSASKDEFIIKIWAYLQRLNFAIKKLIEKNLFKIKCQNHFLRWKSPFVHIELSRYCHTHAKVTLTQAQTEIWRVRARLPISALSQHECYLNAHFACTHCLQLSLQSQPRQQKQMWYDKPKKWLEIKKVKSIGILIWSTAHSASNPGEKLSFFETL